MTDDEAIQLLFISAQSFASANILWSKARFGLYGFPVTEEQERNRLASSQLERATEAASKWKHEPNPYEPLVKFFACGGYIGRWEQRVLDIWCPSGTKYGLPEQAFPKMRLLDD